MEPCAEKVRVCEELDVVRKCKTELRSDIATLQSIFGDPDSPIAKLRGRCEGLYCELLAREIELVNLLRE